MNENEIRLICKDIIKGQLQNELKNHFEAVLVLIIAGKAYCTAHSLWYFHTRR